MQQVMSQNLKSELTQILGNYNIPMEDRTLILEKIEGELGNVFQTIDTAIKNERGQINQKFDDIQKTALVSLQGTIQQARGAVKKAFKMGLEQGIEQAKPTGPTWFQIGIMVGLLTLAGIVAYREFFPRKD